MPILAYSFPPSFFFGGNVPNPRNARNPSLQPQRTSIIKNLGAFPQTRSYLVLVSTSRSCRGDGLWGCKKRLQCEIHKPHHRLLVERCDEAGNNGAGS
ncbi:hypothetical protein PgNI_06093 [Pyricularia grisea]|uniref:Uncharacterized protein n=1 Tax=Pyricularia grisea TaxID=148305 RepID=A0A6P8B765_PYRGI|nr:hypothetical protein PgNI_06093 [Pyricularia grisea]TLD11171.1 hypothetical protein PgNI_06093 [Pyricularia grisea]